MGTQPLFAASISALGKLLWNRGATIFVFSNRVVLLALSVMSLVIY